MSETQRYLARLPDGLASFPECKTKASVLHLFVELFEVEWNATLDKEPQFAFLRTLPPQNSWISEVQGNAFFLALFEHAGWDDSQVESMGHQGSAAMNDNPLYSFLLRMLTSNMIITGAAGRWNRLHLGSELSSQRKNETILVTLRFPNHMMPPVLAKFYTGVFQAVLDDARDKGHVTLQNVADDHFDWHIVPHA